MRLDIYCTNEMNLTLNNYNIKSLLNEIKYNIFEVFLRKLDVCGYQQ